ncbi:hypothetical protein O4H49_03470 [Kiloniella laminariae]|uniref:Uncharacterized protein n=1 Tax=Kiloniella laminariae TaxID=454162 RepID=A0ABT4LIK5_9PROT|nr:hypothetical protein [Kiloniella laminariae]MCZ4279822.1 hypothetical protein [Kiloniella laminariae]
MADNTDPKTGSCRPLFIGSFLILTGIALYLYAISPPSSGYGRYGFFRGIAGLSGWGLIASGCLTFAWLAYRKIRKKRQHPPG